MSEVITYSVTDDFGGDLNYEKFVDDIISCSFSNKLQSIFRNDDLVSLSFITLSVSERAQLDNFVSNHVATEPVTKFVSVYNVSTNPNFIKSTEYSRVGVFAYEGTHSFKQISKIFCVAYMDSNNTNYSIKVYDSTNRKIIAENTFTNVKEDMVELTPISNVPPSRAKIEIHVKKTGSKKSKKVHIKSVDFYMS